MKKVLIILFIVIFLILGIGFGTYYFSNIKINITDGDIVTVGYNEKYEDKGATAKFLFWKVKKINVDSNVDTSKIGTYKVIYSTKFAKKSAKKERIVEVVDKENQQLELLGKDNIKMYTGLTYTEDGYKATDNVDGDLTDKVIVKDDISYDKPGKYKITYEVVDSNNNKAYMERIVEIVERPKENCARVPVLMYHFFYDASAGEHGSDANWMEISLFEQQVKYLVENDYYFPTWQEMIDYIDGKITLPEKSVVITADDGDASYFRLAVPVLKKYNVKATSFVVGSWADLSKVPQWKQDSYLESHTYNMHRGGCSRETYGGRGGLFLCIDHDSGVEDLKKSIEVVGDNKALAYPFGDINDSVKAITADAGIQLAFTINWGYVKPGMDKLELPRIRVSDGISLEGFINRL